MSYFLEDDLNNYNFQLGEKYNKDDWAFKSSMRRLNSSLYKLAEKISNNNHGEYEKSNWIAFGKVRPYLVSYIYLCKKSKVAFHIVIFQKSLSFVIKIHSGKNESYHDINDELEIYGELVLDKHNLLKLDEENLIKWCEGYIYNNISRYNKSLHKINSKYEK